MPEKELKPLSEVTKEDAIAIIKSSNKYFLFFNNGEKNWIFEDRTNEIGEPCKYLYSKRKVYAFWFFNDSIDIELTAGGLGFDDANFDTHYKCYITAAHIGYIVEGLNEIVKPKT